VPVSKWGVNHLSAMALRILLLLLISASLLQADPQLTSWFTANSGKYARIYQSTANETAGTTSTTWSRGTGTQSSPTYADVSEINYSTNWIYIRTTGLASHIMGPWYLDAGKATNFPNFPSNTATVYRIPRTPVISPTKTLTGFGATGRMVNGVSMFDSRDAFSYVNGSSTDATPVNGLTGDGVWNRDGWHNEGVTFDPGLAHQAGNNYHYHAQPIALRYQLGDHVDYNSTTNRYTESAVAVTMHSPILAWAADGLPIYGPYGCSDPTNAASGVRRMISGFTLRDGTNGTTAITVRQVLPLWAQRVQNKATLTSLQYGPAVNATYALGHYIEDFDYRGDLGQTQTTGSTVRDFDLNEQNVRFCVTPEFPTGTWAYFTTLYANGTPLYPYTTGRQYYGSPTGGGVTSITETVTTYWRGGPNKTDVLNSPTVGGGDVTLTWSGIEGGSYTVQASPDLSTWSDIASGTLSDGDAGQTVDAGGAVNSRRFYKVTRAAALASFDRTGFDYTAPPGAPSVTTSAAFGIGSTSATLSGSVTANSVSTTVTFEYGTDTSYGSTVTAAQSPVTGSTATSVSAAISGLTNSTTYHYRAKGVNTLGTTYGADMAFTTSATGTGTANAPGGAVTRGTTVTVTITLPTTPPQPPANLIPTSVTLAGSIAGSSISRPAQGTVIATFVIPANATVGAQNIVVTFNPNPTYTMTGALTIN
jgi:YHYH protein